MSLNQRMAALLQSPITAITWDSITQECIRLQEEYPSIPSGIRWALEYKRSQLENDRGNAAAALQFLKSAIALAPYNVDILDDYKNLVRKSSRLQCIVLIISCKKNEANALRLASQLEQMDIEYLIVSGSDAASIKHVRALQVNTSDSVEAMPQKVVAACTWVHENLGGNVSVLKVADNLLLQEPQKLQEIVTQSARKDVYIGVPVTSFEHDRCLHWEQSENAASERRPYGRPVLGPWADGSAYYLGSGAVEKIVLSFIRFPGLFDGEYYEDKLIGDVLIAEGVTLGGVASYDDFGLFVNNARS
ncbi:ribosome maturation factor RimM [Herbaspirillum autotrophicum]|uniref:hypothetical protein n=1 Tax=Herbaspirillum autotrophicum TaxID=180195 RepID=UPI00067DE129|nr:hypothetical protein [Herbaspirillum autotrophicum]